MAVQTKTEILTTVNTVLADNLNNEISAQDLRTPIIDILDSFVHTSETGSFAVVDADNSFSVKQSFLDGITIATGNTEIPAGSSLFGGAVDNSISVGGNGGEMAHYATVNHKFYAGGTKVNQTKILSLDTTGAILTGSLDVTGAGTVGGGLDVTGDVVIGGSLQASGWFGAGLPVSATPLYPMHLKHTSGANMLLQSDNDNTQVGILFKTEDTDTAIRIKGGIFFKGVSGWGEGNLHFAIRNGNTNDNVTTANTILFVGGDDTYKQRVGINTQTPSVALEVVGSSKINGDVQVTGTLTSAGNFQSANAIIVGSDTNVTTQAFYVKNSDNLACLDVRNNGAVFLGTSNTDAVSGNRAGIYISPATNGARIVGYKYGNYLPIHLGVDSQARNQGVYVNIAEGASTFGAQFAVAKGTKTYAAYFDGASKVAGNLEVTGTITATGDVNLNGNQTTIGDNSNDVLLINAANVSFANLPTSDPGVVGRLWNDNGVLRISM